MAYRSELEARLAKKTTKEDKGGFVYSPFRALDKDDKIHRTPDGGLRSMGAMTYGGLKSFLYAGVRKEDPRVKAAVDWIRRHYTLEENIGMGKNGLYYYYHTFGKAMDAWGEDPFLDAAGKKHVWRRDFIDDPEIAGLPPEVREPTADDFLVLLLG